MSATPPRLVYPDLLRIIAMLAVVTLHVAMRDLQRVRLGSAEWQLMNLYDGAARWCVPIYVMVSGLFLLRPGRNADDLRTAYRKTFGRALRLASILVIWSLVYQVFLLRATRMPLTPRGAVAGLWDMWFGPIYYHLWFLYMLVPLYFLAPLVQLFIARTEPHHWRTVVVVLGIGGPVLTFVTSLVAIYSGQGMYRPMPEFSGYLFYFFLGWWLGQTEWSSRQRRGLYLAGLLGVTINVGGTAWASSATGTFNETFYNYLTLPTAAAAMAIFVAVKQVAAGLDPSPRMRRLVEQFSAVTLGIYLIHPALIETFFRLSDLTVRQAPVPVVVMVPAVSLLVFVASMLGAWVARRVIRALPRGKDWVGWVM
ncbi:acyltransferase [Tessaracoccus sp. SD287]|uniref:acyltransferase n=1 Tax=Tessaracoccus sp. SD287 TaxID=2782008 RepID=UPI001A97224C|nr:acyltransferase [Tessaracoccus sp. SD287]